MRLLICWLLAQVLAAATASYFHELSMVVLEPPLELANDSFFGYSITYDRQSQNVVVSAPRADLDGQVYSCNITTKHCFKLDVMLKTSDDDRYDTRYNQWKRHDHHFWLGASVKADSKNLLVCAPRHTEVLTVTRTVNEYGKTKQRKYFTFGTAGRCYVKDLSSADGFQSLRSITGKDRAKGVTHDENVTDSFGWSIDIAADHSARVGGPAMSAGRMMTYADPSADKSPALLNGNSTAEKVAFNFGYSIATGNFFNTTEKHVAVGTPYGEIGRGKVIFLDAYNSYRWTIYDDVVGTMFGAALCSAKLEKERTSILIGAPAFFNKDKERGQHKYHTGMVLIYMPASETQMKLKRKIEGPEDGGFFGASIANVGDMDQDNLDEIVIAAPYKDDGRGTVYLYSGSVLAGDSDSISWLQEFKSKEFKNFGLSLSALQFSENGCNDLAIGAPGNDKVAVYHCIPSVTVRIEAIFPNLQNRTDKTRFEFQSCLNVIYPEKPIDIKAKFRVTVRISHPNATLSDKTRNYEYDELLQRGKTQFCKPIKVLTSEKGDYEQDIQFDITARLLDDPALSKDFDLTKATVSNHSVLIFKKAVRAADCKNESCEPNLSLDVKFTAIEPYLIGSTVAETLQVLMLNGDGDTAYLPCARIKVTEGDVTVQQAPTVCKFDERQRQCTCQLLGPLASNSQWNISEETAIELDMASLTSESRGMSLRIDVFKRCNNKEPPSYTRNISIQFKNDTSGVRVEGKTDQGDIVKLTKSDINLFGKMIHHTYTITNTKGTNWKSSPLCKIFLKKNPFIEFKLNTIQVYRDNRPYSKCEGPELPGDSSIVELTCDIGDLFKKDFITVVIPFFIPPGKSDGAISETSNITVHTELSLHFDSKNEDIGQSVTTTLMLKEVFLVPTWIIVVAVLVGLLLLGLLAFALYECGFLRRKTKKKLEDLKTDVKRKSMILHRQSMRLSDSARAALANRSYRELLDEAEAKEAEEVVVTEKVNEVKKVKEDCQPTASNGHQRELDADLKNQIEISLKKRLLK